MELRRANSKDYRWIMNALCIKQIPFCTNEQIRADFEHDRLFAIVENDKVLATVSLVEEPAYAYTAIKRMCILNKKNCGKGIARFAIHEIQQYAKGKIGATPWDDNVKMRHLLESEGFRMQYVFAEKWCFYAKEIN